MKKLILLFIGLVPLPLGYFVNYLAMKVYYDKILPYEVIGIAFLIAWFSIGMATYHFTDSDQKSIAFVHLFGFIDLLLILFQEVIKKQYWHNQLGIATQFFYLPLINISRRFTFFLSRLYWVYVVAFAFMCIAFYLGRLARKKQIKDYNSSNIG